MVSIIRAPAWCNDKGGVRLSLISSSISIYYPHRHEHHRTVTAPPPPAALATRSAVDPLIRQCFFFFLVFPSTVISEPPHLIFRSTEISSVSEGSSGTQASPFPYDHTPLWFAGGRSVRWKRGRPHAAVMWGAEESWQPQAQLSASSRKDSESDAVHHLTSRVQASVCVCAVDSWLRLQRVCV